MQLPIGNEPSTDKSASLSQSDEDNNKNDSSGHVPAQYSSSSDNVHAGNNNNNASSVNGNNTRSFRFLLTLALRKAQTAVTLDNGGHVGEAIRTYREAIGMLGLVLSRTNEEDGRQRLLHFRQTYSDRVTVLSSLRPLGVDHSITTAASETIAHDNAAVVIPQTQKQSQLSNKSTVKESLGNEAQEYTHNLRQRGEGIQSEQEQKAKKPQQYIQNSEVSFKEARLLSGQPKTLEMSQSVSDNQHASLKSDISYSRTRSNSDTIASSKVSSIQERIGGSLNAVIEEKTDLGTWESHVESVTSLQKDDNSSFASHPATGYTTPDEQPIATPILINKPLPPVVNSFGESRARSASVSSSQSAASNTTMPKKKRDDGSGSLERLGSTRLAKSGSNMTRKLSKSIGLRSRRGTLDKGSDGTPLTTSQNHTQSVEPGALDQENEGKATLGQYDESRAISKAHVKHSQDPEQKTKPNDGNYQSKSDRRQSVKNQRSLPAILGIGRSRGENKPLPPVPPIPNAESPHQTNTSNIGRRILGALRNNSNHDLSETNHVSQSSVGSTSSGEPFKKHADSADKSSSTMNDPNIPHRKSSIGTQSVAASESSNCNGSSTNGVPLHRMNSRDSEDTEYVSNNQASTKHKSKSKESDPAHVTARTYSSSKTPKAINTTQISNTRNQKLEITTPVIDKECPPIPGSLKSPTRALTKQQKRQSGATHKLAGLFRRKQSVPDIVHPNNVPRMRDDSIDITTKIPSPSIQSAAAIINRDRRLSSSTSTPNLAEVASAAAAAAAAGADQNAMAMDSFATNGSIPPMPTPPPIIHNINTNMSSISGSDELSDDSNSIKSPKVLVNGSVTATQSLFNGALKPAGPDYQDDQTSGHQMLQDSACISGRSQLPALESPVPRVSNSSHSEAYNTVPERKSSIASGASHSAGYSGTGHPSGLRGATGNVGLGPSIYNANSGRATLFDVEEDQRLEMFDASTGGYSGSIGPPPPKSSPLSSLWFIHTMRKSMTSGGAHLTPSLYIPRRLWYQSGIRIMGIETKLSVVGQLTQTLNAIVPQLTLPDLEHLAEVYKYLQEDSRAETVPWEAEDVIAQRNGEKDNLHKSCVALSHWLSNLEEVLDYSRKLLSKKLKFISPSATATSNVNDINLHGSLTHLPSISTYDQGYYHQSGNSNMDSNSYHGPGSNGPGSDIGIVPQSPLSPTSENDREIRISDVRAADTLGSSSNHGASSINSGGAMQLNKDQMGNARFKGLGKLGKSVDKLYSNMQKEKLEDTTAYIQSLQRLFDVVITVLEPLLQYFARISSDVEMVNWFSDAPQESSILESNTIVPSFVDGSIVPGSTASYPNPHTNTASSQSSGSKQKAAPLENERATSADRKNRRRSNYFSTANSHNRQNADGEASTHSGKLRGDSVSSNVSGQLPLPQSIPALSIGGSFSSVANLKFILPVTTIKNPKTYIQHGMGRTPGVIYARLLKVTEWLNQVLIAWIVRDLQVLFAKYIKRLREWLVE